jgi:CRP/FNR family transcriptional regulator, cyclic AMP receptor protein
MPQLPCPCDRPCADLVARTDFSNERVRLSRRQRLWVQGDEPHAAIIVCSGALFVTNTTHGGSEQVVALSTRGFALGFEDVLEGARRTTAVDVVMGGSAVVLPRDRIEEALHRGGPSAHQLASMAARSARMLARRVRELAYGTVEQRLARLLLHLCEDGGIRDAHGILLPTQISRLRLALALGCRAETLVRILRTPGLVEVVSFQREGIRIRDVEALRRMSAGD